MKNIITKTIKSINGATAEFAPELGAICSSLLFNNRELLFQHDFFWDKNSKKTRGGIPFLFPICGRLERDGKLGTYLYENKLYEMSAHGFADKMPWNVLEQKDDSEITFELTHTEDTIVQFPFQFRILLNYKVSDNSLTATVTFENTGENAMPFYAGFHPYFFTKLEQKENILFSASPTYSIQYNERCNDVIGTKNSPELPLPVTSPALKDLLMRTGNKKAAQIIFSDNFKIDISTSVDDIDFPYIQLYTLKDEPFFCVEPWMGAPNTLNSVTGSKWIPPGETKSAQMTISI